MNPIVIALGVLLVASATGNAWLLHERDGAIAAVATATQLNADTAAAAGACKTSVDRLAVNTMARSAYIDKQLAGWGGLILTRQHEASEALSARPANPADLCASLTAYLQGRIREDAAGAKR